MYTDGTKDNDGDLKIYSSRYVQENKNIILKPIKILKVRHKNWVTIRSL